jgi:hypothetical protein
VRVCDQPSTDRPAYFQISDVLCWISDLEAPFSMRDGNSCTIELFLVGKISTDTDLKVTHDPGGVHVVPDEPVSSAVVLRRGIHMKSEG